MKLFAFGATTADIFSRPRSLMRASVARHGSVTSQLNQSIAPNAEEPIFIVIGSS